MLLNYAFEKAIYDNAGVPNTFVGHPAADRLADYPGQAAVRARLGLQGDAAVIALLPGSRVSEIQSMAGLFVAAARQIAAAVPGARFVTPLVNQKTRVLFEAALQGTGLNIQLLDGQSEAAMAAADVALVKSGTATLECALLQRPMVITYRASRLTAWLMRRSALVPYVGLPNILAGEFVVPEFIQEAATPEALSGAVIDLLRDAPRRKKISERFAGMQRELRQNTAQKAADAVMPYVEQS
jgi:lipid-A-disaccharide synthase